MSVQSSAEAGAPGRLEFESIDSALERVLQRPEFQPAEEGVIARLLRQLLEGLELGHASSSLTWFLFTAFALLLTYALVLALRSYRPRRATKASAGGASSSAPSAGDRVAELSRRAREARAAGDLVLALRLSFFALVVGLSRRGDLEYRDAWTNRELAERGRAPEALAPELASLVADLDAKTFGREPVDVSDLERMDALRARWLKEPEEAR